MLNSVMRKLSALALLAIGIVAGGVAAAAGPTVLTQPTNQPTCVYFPITIQSSGSYILGSNLVLPPSCDKNGILINVDNVVLDLGGFSIIGRGGEANGIGISASNRANIVVKNGSVLSMPGSGISLGANAMVADVTVTNSGHGDGIQIVNGTVRHVRSTGNKINGIETTSVSQGSEITNSVASNNGNQGILTVLATVSGNTVTENAAAGIFCDPHGASTIQGNVASKNGAQGIFCELSSILNNVCQLNTLDGIRGSGQITNNTVSQNLARGIFADNPASIVGNVITENALFGILTSTIYSFGNNQISFNNGETDMVKMTPQTSGGVEISPNICDGNTTCPGP